MLIFEEAKIQVLEFTPEEVKSTKQEMFNVVCYQTGLLDLAS